MEIRKAVKKIVALTAGITMLGATIMGAAAADLSAYPSPFVKDGVANAVVVVGTDAATSDVVGAIDIAASLQAAATSKVAVSVSGAGVSVVGGEDVDVELGNSMYATTPKVLKDNDVTSLLDTTIDFLDEDIDVHEEIQISSDLVVDYSLDLARSADEEFLDVPYLTSQNLGAIEYRYVFEDPINHTLIADDTNAAHDTLELSFLGKSIEITKASATGFTVKSSNEYFMAVGDVVNIDGHTVTLVNVGDLAVVVKVDGQTQTITAADGAKTFDEAGDYKVDASDIFYVDEKEDRSVTLQLGDDITTAVVANAIDGESMELFGYSEEEDESEWVWVIKTTGDNLDWIGATHNFRMTEKSAPDVDEKPAQAIGEKIMLPNDYAYVEATSLETDGYETLTMQPMTKTFNSNPYVVMQFTHTGEDELFTVSGTDTATVWAKLNTSATNDIEYWADDSGTKVLAQTGGNFTFMIDSDPMTILYNNATGNFTLSIGTEEWNVATGGVDANNFKDFFGTASSENDGELFYKDATNAARLIDSVDEGAQLSEYGIKTGNDPESMMDDDKLELVIPDEMQTVKVIVGSSATSVAGSTGSATSEKVNAIGVGLGVLDSDVTVGSQNMIVVGGPCVNTIAMELMGNPTDCTAGFEMGKAMIKLYESNGKTAMLVAGYGAQDTQGATRVVAQYGKYALSGMEASVVVTSLSNIKVE